MASKITKPVLHKKTPAHEKPPTEQPTGEPGGAGEDSEEYRAFEAFGRAVMAVPKKEIDAEERKEKRKKARGGKG